MARTLLHDAETFGVFFIIIRLPFFLTGILLWLAVGAVRLPVHLAYFIALLVWLVGDLLVGRLRAGSENSFELRFAAWRNNIRTLCSDPVRDYLGGFQAIVDWLLVRQR
jgi:hypothetical protein